MGEHRRARSIGAVALLLWVAFVLASAVANLMIAVSATDPSAARVSGRSNLAGPDAVASGWPAPTPQPWPAPDNIGSVWTIAHRETYARSGGGEPTMHWMLYDEFGWPWPVLSRVQTSRPVDDSPFTSVESESGLRFVPLGAVVPPIMAGSLLWLILVAPFLAVPALRRRLRRARGQCLACGYPLRETDSCPECGTPARS